MNTIKFIRLIIRKSIPVFLFLSMFPAINSQNINVQQRGLIWGGESEGYHKSQAIFYRCGWIWRRYEGVKGSPRLYDTLVTSFLNVRGQDYYIQLKSDIDLVNNTLLFLHPRSGSLTQIPSEIVNEVVINKDGKELTYRTFEGSILDRDLKEKKFCQLLMEKPVIFLKLPVKKMVEASYKGAYSPDRRYDEFITFNRYYIMGSDSIFHQLQLSKKSLLKLFPDRKSLIEEGFGNTNKGTDEEIIISILEKF